MQKSSLTPDTESSDALRHGQFQPPVNPAPRPRRSPWGAIASAAVLVVLVTIFTWLLLPRLTPLGVTAGHGRATPTTAPATPTTAPATPTTTPATPTTAPATPTTAPATPTSPSTQQFAFTSSDSGRTVRFSSAASRFTLTLKQQTYPQAALRLDCNPQDAVGTTSGMIYAPPGFYAIQYQTVEAGSCKILDGSFRLTVIVEA